MPAWADVRPLLEERKSAFEQMKKITDLAETERRELTADEDAAWRGWNDAIDAADVKLARAQTMIQREKELGGTGEPGPGDPPPVDKRMLPGNETHGDAEQRAAEAAELTEFRKFLRAERASFVPKEKRAAGADNDVEGGFMLAPQTIAAGLLKGVDDLVFMRRIAHTETVSGSESLGVVTLDTDIGDADWTSELAQSTVDETWRIGKRELKPGYLTKETKLSRPLVRRTSRGAERLVLDRLAYKFGITEEKGFLTGTGNNQPLGVFTASAQGISTGRDVSTGNTATEIGSDGLIEAKHNQKGQYWPRLRWIFHRDAIKRIRKIKDGNGLYIWTPGSGVGNGLTSGLPDTILDVPYFMSEYAPNTFTTGLYVGIIGDFEYYWIVDSLALEIQMLVELYARTNQFGYIGRKETDGMPVLEEAFTRVKLA